MTNRITTAQINPPIPIRGFDWSACFDGCEPGDLVGYGATEDEAVKDLLGQVEESGDEV